MAVESHIFTIIALEITIQRLTVSSGTHQLAKRELESVDLSPYSPRGWGSNFCDCLFTLLQTKLILTKVSAL